jgi:hypothetical protein
VLEDLSLGLKAITHTLFHDNVPLTDLLDSDKKTAGPYSGPLQRVAK